MAEKCKALLFHCPKCERSYKSPERMPTCACGQDLHCQKWAVPGYNYCENHGGPAPSRNFYGKGRGIVTGENGQFALTRLASKFVEMNRDGRVLSNRASIEIVQDRITELLERMGTQVFPDQLETLRNLWEEYKAKGGDGSLEGIKVKKQLEAAFEAVYHDYMAWSQIFEAVELRSKMVEREGKLLKDIHASLTAEDAYKLTAKLLGAIIASVQQQPEIPDAIKSRLLKRVEYEFTRIIGEGSGEGTERVGGEVIDA